MQTLDWLESHVGDLDQAIALANQYHWNLTIVEHDDRCFVKGGEKVLFSSKSKEALQAFLYGMGLAYSVIPDELTTRFRELYDLDSPD